jgi:hypothetical protein
MTGDQPKRRSARSATSTTSPAARGPAILPAPASVPGTALVPPAQGKPAAGSAETASSEAVAVRAFPSVSHSAPLRTPPEAPAVLDRLDTGFTCCSPDLAVAILDRLADGESLRSICNDIGMPSRKTVLRWLAADEAFREAYARARDWQADALDDEMAEVIAAVRTGRMDPQAGRVVLSGMQWRASKLAPKRYGDALALKHSGGVAVAPVEMDADHAKRVARAILDGVEDAPE